MIVNLRNRLPELRTNMAGNYIGFCNINFIDTQTPKDFRDRWTDIVNGKRPKDVTAKVNPYQLSDKICENLCPPKRI